WLRGVCLLAVACMIHVVLFSFSRGAQLGLAIIGAMLFVAALVMLPRKGLTIGLAIVFVLLTLALAGKEVRAEFMSIFADREELDASAASRFDTWRAAAQCMFDHPGGVGPRNFNLLAEHYGLMPGKSAHNLWLTVGAECGVLGLAGLILFYASTIVACFRI